MGHSAALGTAHDIDLPGGRICYHERGTGSPVVFVHGLLVNANLWRKVVPAIADAGYRCLTPDWPLGSHSIPVPHADLTPPGLATLIESFLEELDLRDVTLVANDTGGALTQILLARKPSRVARVVLTPSDCYSNFLPPIFRGLTTLAKVPGSMGLLTTTLRVRALHRLPFTFGWLTKRPVAPEVVDGYLEPSRHDRAIRKDLRHALAGLHRRYTLAAAESFPEITVPVLIAWAPEDKVFPLRYGERLAADLPNATLRLIEDSYTFVPEDQPELLAELILEFTREHAAP
ncbi:alpha/beta hydrolase [Aldersonia sp. NBC_00410]|uniref:alpha/beta fold hydrolase n=1 Tax=Aldersonia sp. NBC_00410 TaxID=2975954 RepID=UPI00224C8534|nr:alpha/beta hydrolase [Aldersonia sp. NBC_00410]MCX5043432.1 alpha/beta hydrolase [Aldersonia sp. NBC_00410]